MTSGPECQADDWQQATRDLHALASQAEEDADGGGKESNCPERQQDPTGEDGTHHDNQGKDG